MVQLDIPDNGERVAAILDDPQTYFAQATRRAWQAAEADVDADLRARAEHRRNHAEPQPAGLPAWGPAK